jgi:signal transduction histidine kinase
MSNQIDMTIENLKAEIQTKDEIISRLEKVDSLGELFPYYLHEESHILASLSFRLTTYFNEFSSSNKIILQKEIIEEFEQFRNIHDSMSHLFRNSNKKIELNKCIEEVVNALQPMVNTYRISVTIESINESDSILVPDMEIKQSLLNIIINSIESFQTKRTAKNVITIKTLRKKKSVIVEIIDNGSGISDEISNEIWEPFFTTKRQNVGIGLYITKQLIDRINGKIAVSSSKGQGTEIIITLPASAKCEV